MSVSGELLCSFELLKPLDSTALKNHIKKGRNKRNSMLNSPVSLDAAPSRKVQMLIAVLSLARSTIRPKLLNVSSIALSACWWHIIF